MTAPESPCSADLASQPSEVTRALGDGQRRFIDLWGQMASNWGVPRSMAEVHALLFIVGRPLHAEEIMSRLHISRGNASMTLRTLEEWGIVHRVQRKECRKELYEAEQDVSTLFCTVICTRKRREIDPLLQRLEECRECTRGEQPGNSAPAGDPEAQALRVHNRKLDEMLDFVRAFDALASRFLAEGGRGLGAALSALKDGA